MDHQIIIKLIDDCLDCIIKGKTDAALTLLLDFEGGKYRSKFIGYANRLNRLNKERNQGILDHSTYDTRLNQLNAGLIKTLDDWKKNSARASGGKLRRWLVIGGGVIIILAVIWRINCSGIDCGPKGMVAIHVADFVSDEQKDPFSRVLYSELRNDLDKNQYAIYPTKYLDDKQQQQISKYQNIYFNGHCEQDGLIVYGDYFKMESFFICFIKLVNLAFKVETFKVGPNKYYLRSPDNIELKVGEQASFIADFIRVLLGVHMAESVADVNSALQELDSILSTKEAQENEKAKGLILYYRGIAQTMKGDVRAAEDTFGSLVEVDPSLEDEVANNLEYLEEVREVQFNFPEYIPLLKKPDNLFSNENEIKEKAMVEKAFQQLDLKDSLAIKAFLEKYPEHPENENLEARLEEIQFWSESKRGGFKSVLDYLSKYPEGLYVNEARQIINAEDDKFWGEYQDQGIVGAKRYSSLFPNGKHALEAKEKIDKTGNKISDYKTIQLADNTWLSGNLNLDIGEGCFCYNGVPENCDKYGRLYTLEVAKKACQELGPGWRLPTEDEWKALAIAFGGYHSGNLVRDPKKAYGELIEGGSSLFAVQLGGYGRSDGSFGNLEKNGHYWSNNETNIANDNMLTYLFASNEGQLRTVYLGKFYALSVRCVDGS